GVFDGAAGDHVPVLRAERVAAPGRLETEQAAAGGRVPDGSAQVVAVGERHEAGRDRRGRSTAGATGGAVEVPRVAGRAEQQWFDRGHHPELTRVRLAEDDQAGRAEAYRQLLVYRGHVVGEEP